MSDALDNAAEAALFVIEQTQNPKLEHLGALYSTADGYGRTAQLVDGNAQHVHGTLSKPSGTSWAALFHNHPPAARGTEASAEQFSDDDRAMAQRLGVPSYISTPSGRTRRFDPGTGKTEDVLADFPIDEFKTFLMQRLLNRSADDPRGLRL